MIEKTYIELVDSKNLLELYEMYKRISIKHAPEHYDYLKNVLKTKTSEDPDNIPDYSELSMEELEKEKETLGVDQPLKSALIEKFIQILVNKEKEQQSHAAGELASRSRRLAAVIIDLLILTITTATIVAFLFGLEKYVNLVRSDFLYVGVNFLLVNIIFFLINGQFLEKDGQTVGKKVLNIKIVTENNSVPSLKDSYLKRYLAFNFAAQIPIIGLVFSLIDVMFIFQDNRRCVHDLFANTKVVNA